MSEKMTIEKSRIEITKVVPEEIDEVEYNLNRGFILGHESRQMEIDELKQEIYKWEKSAEKCIEMMTNSVGTLKSIKNGF